MTMTVTLPERLRDPELWRRVWVAVWQAVVFIVIVCGMLVWMFLATVLGVLYFILIGEIGDEQARRQRARCRR